MTTLRRQRGVRERLGADVARVWARELQLGNPAAKAVLLAVANYMNEDGAAWPGVATIARDTCLSEETVVKRLRWLEGIGAVALFKCFLDANGRRSYDSENHRKPTSSEIRFQFDADVSEIEAKAQSDAKTQSLRGAALKSHDGDISSRHQRGLNEDDLAPDQPPVSPLPAPCQPPPAGESHIEGTLEQVDSPPPPSRGEVSEQAIREGEESFQNFAVAFPAPITDFQKCRAVWAAMLTGERDQAVTGARGYRAFIDDLKRRGKERVVKDAHRWLRDRQWLGYVQTGKVVEATAQRFNAAENSDEWKAWTVFYRACGASGIPLFLIRGSVANVPTQWPPVGREYVHSMQQKWVNVIDGSGQFSAWKRRLLEMGNTTIASRTIMHEGRMVRALNVPSEWPPNRRRRLGMITRSAPRPSLPPSPRGGGGGGHDSGNERGGCSRVPLKSKTSEDRVLAAIESAAKASGLVVPEITEWKMRLRSRRGNAGGC